ncbi:MAG TPA: hypothetical protein VLM38_01010 [Blastocatellia bacterium]|nr:hypothetical protein [Blastocatellia bacterium]
MVGHLAALVGGLVIGCKSLTSVYRVSVAYIDTPANAVVGFDYDQV